MPRVAIILVDWNGKDNTLACLASLKDVSRITYHVSTIVVDNGSTDDSVAVIHKKFPNVEIIKTGENLGFTGGNNIGIRKALEEGADFVWLLNNDTTVDKHALSPLLDAFGGGNVGVVGSKIYFAPGCEFHTQRYRKNDRGRVLWYAGGVIDWENMYASHRGVDEVDSGQYDSIEETQFVTGCSMMVKREVFQTIGLLDDRYFAYLEDLDFCLRATDRGFRLMYVPASIVWHNNAGSSAVGGSTHQYYMTRNRFIIGMRYASLRTKFALIREAARFVFIGPSIRRRAILHALTGRFGRQ